MTKRLRAVIVSVSLLAALFVVAGALGVSASDKDGAYPQLSVYSEVLQRIRSEYVEEPNFQAVKNGALHGLLESLDANSSYLNPTEYKKYKEHRENKEARAGIGATISKRFGFAAVVSVIPESPADRAGLATGDIIEALEGRSTREMSLAEIRNTLMGAKGSHVTFSVVRPRKAEPEKMELLRDEIAMPPVSEKVIESNIGYIKVSALSKGKAQEIAGRIQAAHSGGAKKLILDLRNVAEGDIPEGIAAANLFLDRGTIAYLKGQKYPREDFNADPQRAVTKLPLVVLVNRGTAGAAEIAAAALLENGRADVLGEKTFGIGSVQRLIEINDGSAVILSVAKYYSPGGKAIQDTAVTPNIVVATAADPLVADEDDDDDSNAKPEPKKPVNEKNDEQLQRAIAVLKNKAA
jgi:carboxyl-terminal processing protease